VEALTAHVEPVLPDEAMTVAAHAALPRSLAELAGMRVPDIGETHFRFRLYRFKLQA